MTLNGEANCKDGSGKTRDHLKHTIPTQTLTDWTGITVLTGEE